MMRKGDKGVEVKLFQWDLTKLGYPLPRWGADGILGSETLAALALFQRDHKGAAVDDRADVVSDNELAAVRALAAAVEPLPPANYYDSRRLSSRVHVYGKRSWKDITGVCLHQTACNLGEGVRRWDTVGAHGGVTRGGKIIQLHEFTDLVVHGNGWNTRCVGIEMDGHYEGIEGNIRTFWRDPETPNAVPQTPTDELVASAKDFVRWICAIVKHHGGEVKYLVAHRQASKDRQNDPGSGLWQRVAIPLLTELKLSDGGLGFKIGTGYAIPEVWDSTKSGVAY